MKKLFRYAGALLLCCFAFCQGAAAEQGMDASQPAVRQEVGIVLLGNSRYLEPEYQDILNRYFVRCYSQYRYPMEFGADMQQKFAAACEPGPGSRKAEAASAGDLTALVKKLDKEQLLLLRVDDVVKRKRRSLGWPFGSEDTWEAVVEVKAVLVNREGIVREEKIMKWADEQYTPDRALLEAYTGCIRSLQQQKIFP